MKRKWWFILGASILLLLPLVLLLAGVPFRDLFIIAVVCGLLLGIVLANVADLKVVNGINWEALFLYISLSTLDSVIMRLHMPPLSITDELLNLLLLNGMAVFAVLFLVLLGKTIANRPAVLIPIIAVPFAAAYTSSINYFPIVIGLLGGVLYGFLHPRCSVSNETENERLFFWICQIPLAFLIMAYGINMAFNPLHTILLRSIVASLTIMYSTSFFINSFLTWLTRRSVGTEVTES